EGQIVGLIGPNGAGKTTLFNCLSRLYTPDRGDVLFDGRPILGLPAHRIAKLGIGRTFQNLALFPTMTVLQNVMVGVHSKTRSDFFSNALRLPWVGREEERIQTRAAELLEFLDLGAIAHHPAAGLPFGTLKRVEPARARASRRSTAGRRSCTGSVSPSRTAGSRGSSGPRVPARRRVCAPCAAWSGRRARSASTRSRSPAGRPRTSSGWGSPTCRRGAGRSR